MRAWRLDWHDTVCSLCEPAACTPASHTSPHLAHPAARHRPCCPLARSLSLPFCLRSNHPATLQEQSALQPPTLHLAHLSNHVLKRKCAPRRLLPSLDASPMAWHPACSCPSAQPRTDSRQACPAGRSLSGQKPADLEGISTAGKMHAGAQSMHLHRQAGSPSARASVACLVPGRGPDTRTRKSQPLARNLAGEAISTDGSTSNCH